MVESTPQAPRNASCFESKVLHSQGLISWCAGLMSEPAAFALSALGFCLLVLPAGSSPCCLANLDASVGM